MAVEGGDEDQQVLGDSVLAVISLLECLSSLPPSKAFQGSAGLVLDSTFPPAGTRHVVRGPVRIC